MATYEDKMNAPKVSADTLRNIQNIRTVTKEFEEEKSAEAKMDRARSGELKKQKEVQKQLKDTQGEERQQLRREERFMNRQFSKMSRRTDIKGRKIIKKKSITSFTKWGGISLAITAWFWPALFSLIALTAFMAQSVVEMIKADTWGGWFVGLFIDFEKYSPSLLLGWGFALVSSFLAFISVLGFMAWFRLVGIETGKTLFTKFMTYALLAVSILPILNIFPALIIWVVWGNLSSLSRKR